MLYMCRSVEKKFNNTIETKRKSLWNLSKKYKDFKGAL